MSIFDVFSDLIAPKNSASKATERLKLVLAHERSANLPYIEAMKNEILEVIKKYTRSSNIRINADSNQHINMLEIEIVLNEK